MSPHTLRIGTQRWHGLAGIALLGIVAATCAGALPGMLGALIDAAETGTVTTPSFIWYGAAALGVQLLRWGTVVAQTNEVWHAANAVRVALVAHLVTVPTAFFRGHGIGELAERVESDVTDAIALPTGILPRLLHAVVLVVTLIIGLSTRDRTAAAVLLGYVIIGSAVVHATQRESETAWEDERIADAAAFDGIEETLAGATDIRAVRASADRLAALVPRFLARMTTHRDASLQQQWGAVAAGIVVGIGWMLAAGIGIWRHGVGVGTVGTAFALLASVRALVQPIEIFGSELSAVRRAWAATQRCDALFATEPYATGAGRELPEGALAVDVTNVSFTYPGASTVTLDRLTCAFAAGSHVALVGRTGSGKTTLGRLIARLELPANGAISIAGIPLAEIAEGSLRDRVGVITQDGDTLPGTLRAQLSGFDPLVSDTQIDVAIAALGLGAWYAAFANGLDTEISADARVLTPGEAQLVAVVRVFLRQPGLVILDEATAHIDPATELLVRTALARLAAERTTITIAHRLSTIEHADTVVVMADGHILEVGAPAVLGADPGSAYSSLIRAEREVLP